MKKQTKILAVSKKGVNCELQIDKVCSMDEQLQWASSLKDLGDRLAEAAEKHQRICKKDPCHCC